MGLHTIRIWQHMETVAIKRRDAFLCQKCQNFWCTAPIPSVAGHTDHGILRINCMQYISVNAASLSMMAELKYIRNQYAAVHNGKLSIPQRCIFIILPLASKTRISVFLCIPCKEKAASGDGQFQKQTCSIHRMIHQWKYITIALLKQFIKPDAFSLYCFSFRPQCLYINMFCKPHKLRPQLDDGAAICSHKTAQLSEIIQRRNKQTLRFRTSFEFNRLHFLNHFKRIRLPQYVRRPLFSKQKKPTVVVFMNMRTHHQIDMIDLFLQHIVAHPNPTARCICIFCITVAAAIDDHNETAPLRACITDFNQNGITVANIDEMYLSEILIHHFIAFLIYTLLNTSTNIVMTIAHALANPNLKVLMP